MDFCPSEWQCDCSTCLCYLYPVGAATSDGSSNLGSACATVSLLHPAHAFFVGWYGLHQDNCAREWISIIHHGVGVIYNWTPNRYSYLLPETRAKRQEEKASCIRRWDPHICWLLQASLLMHSLHSRALSFLRATQSSQPRDQRITPWQCFSHSKSWMVSKITKARFQIERNKWYLSGRLSSVISHRKQYCLTYECKHTEKEGQHSIWFQLIWQQTHQIHSLHNISSWKKKQNYSGQNSHIIKLYLISPFLLLAEHTLSAITNLMFYP